MAISKRMCAFRKDDGTYRIFNAAKTALIAVGTNPENWIGADELKSLTVEQLRLVENLELVIETPFEDDEYNVFVDVYGSIVTTDTTHVNLKGFSNISSVHINGSDTCRMLVSLDGQKTWQTYDIASKTWETVQFRDLYYKGMTVFDVNAMAEDDWKKVFAQTTFDYAISLTRSERLNDVIMTFPPNRAPDIAPLSCAINPTHKQSVMIQTHVEDFENDRMTFRALLNGNVWDEGKVSPANHGDLSFLFTSYDLLLGNNEFVLEVTDEKGATSQQSVTVVKDNKLPTLTYIISNDLFSFVIEDPEADKLQYRILLNGDEIVPMTDFAESPISELIHIPRDKIIFGEKNKLTVEYQDNIDNDHLRSTDCEFDGYYYGLLFTSPALMDEVDENGKITNKRFYSDSVGGIANLLIAKPMYRGGQSSTYEVHVLNRSNQTFGLVTIYKQKANEYVEVEMSKTQAPFIPMESITFDNIPFDGYERFYVRLKAKGNYVGKVSTEIHGTAEEVVMTPAIAPAE